MAKYVKNRDERGDKEVVLIIPEEDREDTVEMVKSNGFSTIEKFLESRYVIALRTYRRKQKERSAKSWR